MEGQSNLPRKANPCCGREVDTGHEIGELMGGEGPLTKPRAGDISVCLNCGAVLVYVSEFGDSRKASFEDWQNLNGSQRGLIRRARAYILKRGRIWGQPKGRGGTGVDFGI